jgi:hypothetical protein
MDFILQAKTDKVGGLEVEGEADPRQGAWHQGL